MKKNLKTIFVSVLAMLSFASCDKNEEVAPSQDLTPRSLVVSLPKSELGRSVEGILAAADAVKYNNVTTILYDGGRNVAIHAWTPENITAGSMEILNVVKPGEVKVIVNVPAEQLVLLLAAKKESDITTALEAMSVADQNPEPIAAGEAPDPVTPYYTSAQQTTYVGSTTDIVTSGDVNTATVILKSITSRFQIGTITALAESGITDVVIEKVYINNYFTTYKGDVITNIAEASWPIDATDPSDPTAIAPWSMIAGDPTVTSVSKVYAFQVYPTLVSQIIFKVSGNILKGFQLADGTTTSGEDLTTPFVNKYITVSGFKNEGVTLDKLAAHTIYTIADFTVKPSDITKQPNQAEIGLTVAIEVAAWTEATLTPEIQ